jgi:hypothetical protein
MAFGKKNHPFIMGAWKGGPLAALVVCPTSRGRTEVQFPRDEEREREVAKATVETANRGQARLCYVKQHQLVLWGL